MKDREDGQTARAREPRQMRERRDLVPGIQVHRGLIEEQDVGLLGERHGEYRALTLAAREPIDPP